MKTFKYKLLAAAAMASCLCMAPAAQATVLSSYLTFDGGVHNTDPIQQGGGEDLMQDDSLSKFVDLDGDKSYDVGEYIYGMITLSDIDASNSGGNVSLTADQVVILFSAQILSLTGGSNGSIELGAIGDATNTYDLRKLLDADANITSGLTDDSVAVFVSTTTDPVGAADAKNFTLAQFETLFTNANNWYQELIVGLIDDDDFFEFVPNTAGALTGADRGAFTVEKSAFAVSGWAPVDVADFADVTHYGDVTLDIGTVNLANATQTAAGWTFRDQSSFFINPIPEPGSLALLGMGLLGMGVGLRRRKA